MRLLKKENYINYTWNSNETLNSKSIYDAHYNKVHNEIHLLMPYSIG